MDDGRFTAPLPLAAAAAAFRAELFVGAVNVEEDDAEGAITGVKNDVIVAPFFKGVAACLPTPILFRPIPPSSLTPGTKDAFSFPFPLLVEVETSLA